MIDAKTVARIKDAADIVEVVSDYVHLTRRGANYMGLCPFHNERTPSFSVSKARNFCYCFSCKKGGSPVNFIMEKEKLSYHDALLQLARKYGIKVEERELTDEERAQQSLRESMLVANEWAMQRMEADLHDTPEGRDIGLQYLYGRHITPEAIKAFRLGYSIDKGDHLVSAAKGAGYDLNVFAQLGLVGNSQNGKYDRFRGRVIFPIINPAGKVIAFGGRDLKGGPAKYINSPESELYKKSNELYGIYQARSAMVKEDNCFLVEGYLDVIGFWQAGIKNVVASSGTALTDGQIALIHRFTNKITLIYDGDAAGIKAALRGIDMLLSHKMEVKVMLLPDGHDPHSFASEHDADYVRKYIEENASDVIRFKIKVLLDEVKNDPQKKVEAVNSIVRSIAHVPNPVTRDIYIRECSNLLQVSEAALVKAVAVMQNDIITRMHRERLSRESASDNTENSTQQPQQTEAETAGAEVRRVADQMGGKTPDVQLTPLEMSVIKYCLQYAYFTVYEGQDDDGSLYSLNAIEYVDEELAVDGIEFENNVCKKILDKLFAVSDNFAEAYKNREAQLDEEINEKRRAGIDEIAAKDITVAMIEREEQRLEEKLAEFKNKELLQFRRDYPGMILASDEDDEIRNTVTNLLTEPHQLSRIYTRTENKKESIEESASLFIRRSVTELKGGVLNRILHQEFANMQKAQAENDLEKVKESQMRINMLIQQRKELGREIGDRIISPHSL